MTPKWEIRKKYVYMYSVSPSQSDLYHLRLLMLHVKGVTSFNSLKTVNGVLQPSFTSAC